MMTRWLHVLLWIAIGGWTESVVLSCAHTAKVIEACRIEATSALVTRVTAALAGADYEDQLVMLVAETALCAVRAAVREAINSTAKTKAAGAPIIVKRGEAWLLAHPQ